MNGRSFLASIATLALGLPGCARETPTAPKADQEAVVKGNSAFAFDLYATLKAQEGNLFFSPYSLSNALGMTYAGAEGDTASEMAKTLHFSLTPDRLAAALAAVDWTVTSGGKPTGYQMATANALWGQKGHAFLPPFLETLDRSFGASLHEVDFKKASDDARQTINQWVEKQTHDKIKDLIGPSVVNPDTRLVLTNAIYFKGDWVHAFLDSATHEGDFHVGANKNIRVPFMHQKDDFKYLENEEVQVLEMPYHGEALSMLAILPKKVGDLAGIEKSLSPAEFGQWMGRLKEREVQVVFPKFRITAQFKLNRELAALGMPSAFSSAADFSGMDGTRDLSISAVVHKAFVDVNEAGTEAAAATGVVVAVRSAAPAQIPIFRADHPFLFAIRDTRSNSILFMGRVAQPGE